MAELLLKVGAGAHYDDGDVLCAFNHRRIRAYHAESLCHPRKARRNGGGLIPASELAADWHESTHQYRFERVSKTEIDRVTIATGQRDRLSDKPNAKGEAIDVRLFVRRQKERADCRLFGEAGREIWYGGRIDMSHAALDKVWAAVEAKTDYRELEFTAWPMGVMDMRSHLPIKVDEFDDAEAELLVASEMDQRDPESPIMLRKRKRMVDYANALSLPSADLAKIRDKSQVFDLRGRGTFSRASIVTVKPNLAVPIKG